MRIDLRENHSFTCIYREQMQKLTSFYRQHTQEKIYQPEYVCKYLAYSYQNAFQYIWRKLKKVLAL